MTDIMALAKKLLVLAKGHSPAVTTMAGKLVIDLVVLVHDATKESGKKHDRPQKMLQPR